MFYRATDGNSHDMSDAECGAICVRKDVMDKFNTVMQETKLDANELMEHLFNLHSCQVKTENDDFIPIGMTFNPNNQVQNGSKNSSIGDTDDVTCLGVTNMDDKVQLLQKLREQANTTTFNNQQQQSGMFQNYNSYAGGTGSGLAPPTMVSLTNQNQQGNELMQPPKKKKKKKNPKPGTSPAQGQPLLVCDGEDLLKSSMCSLCQATFSRFTDLLAHHKEVHSSDTNHPLRCRACGRTQTSEAGLIYHQVYVCKMVERPHQCHLCGLKFQSEEMVLVHKCSGCPRKKYACEFCDHYRTESSSDLEKHMRIHTNDKCYVCKVCGFSTAWKKNLKEHMVKHLGLKPYICDMCGYSTSDRHNLRSHRMKHYQKGEGCEKCGGVCRCNQLPVSGKKKKKFQSPSGDNNNAANANQSNVDLASMKDLECPYPQCVYRTKLEYMMTNHMLRHQGMGDQNIPSANTHNSTVSPVSSAGPIRNKNLNVANNSNSNNNNANNINNVQGNVTAGGNFSQQGVQNNSNSINGGKNTGNNNGSQNRGNNGLTQVVQQQGSNSAGGSAKTQQYTTQASVNNNNTSSASSASPSNLQAAVATGTMANNQNIQSVILTSANQMPLEWKNIGQPNPPTVFSPPAHFTPLVHTQQGHLQQQAMNSAALSSWAAASPLSPSAVPPGLLSNRVSVAMQGQNMVARPMPVFPNMPTN